MTLLFIILVALAIFAFYKRATIKAWFAEADALEAEVQKAKDELKKL